MWSSMLLLNLVVTVLSANIPLLKLEEDNVKKAFDSMPKECTKNGEKYESGQDFEIGRLRYKCHEYGVYTIEGCKSESGITLQPGETKLVDNLLLQCLKAGNSMFYRETTCGVMGMPDCDKVPKPTGFEEAQTKEKQAENVKVIELDNLPAGWKVLDDGQQRINGSNATIHSRTLIFEGIQSRAVRQSGHGVGSVVGMEDVGTDKPQMPLGVFMKALEANKNHKNIVSTQTVGAQLDLHGKGHSSVMKDQVFTPESVGGFRSDVKWSGKTITVNGKTIAADEGTFTFGNSPTGAFIKKEHA